MLENKIQEYPWSYSRLTAYETCPRRFDETYNHKGKWPEERSAQLDWGDAVHAALAQTLRDGTPLPTVFQIFQPWVDRINNTPGELLVEDDCRWAITKDFQPTTYFSNKVWLRVIADVVKLNQDVALIVDWKTGRSQNADSVQLVLTSLVMLVLFPKLQAIRSDFVWLTEDDHTTQVVYRNEAADHWATLMPRVQQLQQAIVDNHFPPKPGRFCAKWCPVKSCEFWGK